MSATPARAVVHPPTRGETRRVINPWATALVVTMATFMEVLDTSIANVALPHIAGSLGASTTEATWVLTSYLVTNAVVLPLSAWLSRVFGRKRFYMSCVAMFTLSSLACGLAPGLGWLVFFRILQGLGGGGLAPVEQAILVDTFPPARRAQAFAAYSIAVVAAPAIGPTLGGWITDNFSWRWVFLINIPVGVVSLLLTGRLVHDPPWFEEERRRVLAARPDWTGVLAVAVGFGALQIMLDKGQQEGWFASRLIVGLAVAAAVAVAAGIIRELTHPDPVVDLSLLRDRNFGLACTLYFVLGFVLFGSTVLLPLMLQSALGYTALQAGMAISPGALVIMAMVPFVARLAPRIGPRIFIACGLVITGLALWHLSRLNAQISWNQAAMARIYQTLGLGMIFVPMSLVAYSYLPREKNNKASSLSNLFRNLGGSFGISLIATFLERRQQYHRSVLGAHISELNPLATQAVAALSAVFSQRQAAAPPDARLRAMALLSARVDQQALVLAFLDCFRLLGLLAFCAVFIVLFIRPLPRGAAAPPAH